ncbi:hypothetical protein BLNAU_20991 [Blattamonas nauphoetae]|uniref:Uncharacterized protein n=1 Tax=Blattamonas nauphoetae TaxID=2049346 RepID=A0ABQ9WX99_9EUKA|nr:hypothetical protein BLNAU_20991 [Blattamonas nauphoetae]
MKTSRRRCVSPPIRLCAKIFPSHRIVLNFFWPLLPIPAGFSVLDHVFESSRAESDASPILVHDGREYDLCPSPEHHSSRQLAVDKLVLVLPPVSLHCIFPPLRQTIAATLLVFFASILDPASAFFHTLNSDILSSLFAVLSEVLAIVAPPPASKEQPFSHLTILIDPLQAPASQSSSLPSLVRLKKSQNAFPSSFFVFQPLPAVVCVSYSEFTTHFSSFLYAVEDMADVTDSDFRTTLVRSAAQVAVNAFNSTETTGTRNETLPHDIGEARVAVPPSLQANAPRSDFHSPSNQKGLLIDDLIDSPSSSFVISNSGRASLIDISNDPQVIIQLKNEAITARLEGNTLTVKNRDRKES